MKRHLVAVLAITVVALGGVTAGAAIAHSRPQSSTAHLPSGFAAQLREMGIVYSDVAAVSDEVRPAALHAASNGSSPVAGKDARPVVVRVKFTDNSYRDHGRRLYVERRALMLIYPVAPVALTGPAGSPSGTVKSTVVDFIDPDSLRYLRAISYSTSSQVDPPTG
jgi:hypothetical protein